MNELTTVAQCDTVVRVWERQCCLFVSWFDGASLFYLVVLVYCEIKTHAPVYIEYKLKAPNLAHL